MIVTDKLVAWFINDLQHVQIGELEPLGSNDIERRYVHVSGHEVVQITDKHSVGYDYAFTYSVVTFELSTEPVKDFQGSVDHVGIGHVNTRIELGLVDFPELAATQSGAVELTEQVVLDDFHVTEQHLSRIAEAW